MKKERVGKLSLWKFEKLLEEPAIRHFVTDREEQNGVSGFTLSYSSHPDRSFIERNRAELATAVGITPDKLFLPSQVHGTRIQIVTSNTSRASLQETDALVTAEKEVCVAVMSADCVPILLFDKRNNVIAAVHSGWRGTVARILFKTLQMLRDEFGSKAADITAGIGPSICKDVYEVGEEVIRAVHENFPESHALLTDVRNGKAKLDLWEANKMQLLEFGVKPDRVEIANLCTVKDNAHFFSARKGDSGRFAAGIMLRG
jgi:polyphenol oxidase